MDPTDIIIPELSLLKSVSITKNGNQFKIFPLEQLSEEILDSFVFQEKIESLNIGGKIIVKDVYNWSEELNIHSFEKISIEFYIKEDSEISGTNKKLNSKKIEFNVINVSQITKQNSIYLEGEDNQRYIRIDFATESPLVEELEKNIVNFDGDFVGYISTDGNGEIPGLINEIFKKLDIQEYEIEPTYNGIWIRENEISYPWAKSKGQSKLEQLLYYITSYAVSKNNPNAVNFYLWRDSYGYHFKSIDSILKEKKNGEIEKLYFSDLSSEENKQVILDIYEMNEANILELSKNEAFQSYYERYSPNYDDFYLDFVDTSISFKKEIVDYDYHRDFNTWESVEEYKLIPNNQSTSNKSIDDQEYIQSLKVDDSIYGYFESASQNTPFYQKWDYIGASGDSRWNDVVYIPQFNITDLDIRTFHTIHKKIREPLIEKRAKYSYMKNLKRKWEVYRCSVCCLTDRYGGIQDQADILRLQGIEDPNNNPEYLALFGVTGIFAETEQGYRIVAAGSFSDVYNYDIGLIDNNGITLSYELSSEPYNKTIKEFYNFADNFDNYEKHIFQNGFKTYDLLIEKNNKSIADLNEYLNAAENFINLSISHYTSLLYEIDSPTQPPDFPLGIANTEHYIEMNPPFRYEFRGGGPPCFGQRPLWYNSCSRLKFNIYSLQFSNSIRYYNIYEYHRYTNTLENPAVNFLESKNFLNAFTVALDTDLENENECNFIWCYDCDSANTLIVKQRKALKIRATLIEQNKIVTHLRDTLKNKFYEKWKIAKEEYLNRKAFFISKISEKVERPIEIKYNNSLYNIKSIKRKPVRGSRYEILARNKGITGAEIGPYLYQIFFNDDSNRGPTSDQFNHPYYDKKYKNDLGVSSYKSESENKKLGLISDVIPENAPPFTGIYDPLVPYDYAGGRLSDDSLYGDIQGVAEPEKLKGFVSISDKARIKDFTNTDIKSDFIQRSINTTNDVSGYDEKYNLYNENLTTLKPPSIVREEISSYVRIEFKSPIGLESIVDFPDGFVRDAGYEYFLPYLVSLTSGPNGRQTINQNIVVIGMDPYGFDVAMKRIPDIKQDGEYYWWWSGIESPQMDLWPEIAFETEYNYYSCHREYENNNIKYSTSLDFSNQLNTSLLIGISTTRRYKDFTKQTVNENFTIYGSMDEALKNHKKASDYSQNLDNLNYASNYLLDVNKSLKVFRNWWSFHIPSNIITIPYFDPAIFDADASPTYSILNQGISVLTNNTTSLPTEVSYNLQYNNYLYSNRNYSRNISSLRSDLNRFKSYEETDTNNFYENYIDLDYSYEGSAQIVSNMESQGIIYIIPNSYYEQKISVFKSNEFFREVHPDIAAYFGRITNWWLSGDHIIYRPGLLTQDVWKYDISGYTEYGIITPPTTKNHPDIFDHNFAGQFIVFSREASSITACEKSELKCINPGGTNTTAGCPDDDPYCNCPAQNRQPTEPEPSYLDLYKMEQEIKECSLIEEHLGEEWLGCVWSNPDNTASCNCPEIGDRFMDYLEYSRTYATFWNTPKKSPLLRKAQKELLFSQSITISIEKNDKIKIGELVSIQDLNVSGGISPYARYYGNWLVTGIINFFSPSKKTVMFVTLNRDSFYKDTNTSTSPVTIKKV